MKLFAASALLAAGLSIIASAAQAGDTSAVLFGVTGKVLVNNGDGFITAQPAAKLHAGSEVFLGEGATATVHFNAANCDVALAEASITRISNAGMCQQAMFKNSAGLTPGGVSNNVVITPVAAPPPSGLISPYFIAGAIFTASGWAVTQSFLQPVSEP